MNSHSANETNDEGLLLLGLDGANPLGFLASLGVMRALNAVADSPRLRWGEAAGSWRPTVDCDLVTRTELPELLCEGLKKLSTSPWSLNTKFPFAASGLNSAMIEACRDSTVRDRSLVDLLAGFGVPSFADEGGDFEGSALKMVRSGDSQGNGLSGYAATLCKKTRVDQIRSAIFETWRFDEPGCALRWAPEENIGYALQATDPSGQPARSVRGANRLAIEAMGMLWAIPTRKGVATTGFSGARQQAFTWPIWTVPLCLDVVQSLICMHEIHDDEVRLDGLSPRGISAVFRSRRIKTSTYYYNFSPSERIA